MSSDNNLQEMEAGTTQSKTAVNAGAKAGDPMQKTCSWRSSRSDGIV